MMDTGPCLTTSALSSNSVSCSRKPARCSDMWWQI
jgi:hypothetical protein